MCQHIKKRVVWHSAPFTGDFHGQEDEGMFNISYMKHAEPLNRNTAKTDASYKIYIDNSLH